MQYAVIYNLTTGDIVCMSTLADETASYNGLIVTVPAGKILKKINPETQEPIFADEPSDTLTDLQLALIELDARLSAGGL